MFKLFNIPKSGIQTVKGIDTWVVSWQRRYGQFLDETEMCYQAFTDRDEAKKLKVALDNAFKLIGTTSGAQVRIKKQDIGL